MVGVFACCVAVAATVAATVAGVDAVVVVAAYC